MRFGVEPVLGAQNFLRQGKIAFGLYHIAEVEITRDPSHHNTKRASAVARFASRLERRGKQCVVSSVLGDDTAANRLIFQIRASLRCSTS
jgi:predicted component of type VI protein secretion system